VAFAVLLLATACGSSATETTAPATATQSEAEAGASLLAGEFASVTGDTVDLAGFEGENVVFWFWEPF